MAPAAATAYEALIQSLSQTAEAHPLSYVVLDANTHELIDSGVDPEKVFERINAKLRPDQVPVVYKKPNDSEVLIL